MRFEKFGSGDSSVAFWRRWKPRVLKVLEMVNHMADHDSLTHGRGATVLVMQLKVGEAFQAC
jgi:hypothetical protein